MSTKPTRAKRIVESIIGIALLAAGIAVAFFVESRGDVLVMFLTALGGFFVSKSLLIDFFKNIWNK